VVITLPSEMSEGKWNDGDLPLSILSKMLKLKNVIGFAIGVKSAKPSPSAKDIPSK
jgi:hypothetical protein